MAITNNNSSRSIENNSSDNLELKSLIISTEVETTSGGTALRNTAKSEGTDKVGNIYGVVNNAEMSSTDGITGLIIGTVNQAKYSGSGSNISWASIYGNYNLVDTVSGSEGDLSYVIGNNTKARMRSDNSNVDFLQGAHITCEVSGSTVNEVAVSLLDFDYSSGNIADAFSYLQIQNDTVPALTSGNQAKAIDSKSTLPSSFAGTIQVGDSTIAETAENAGAIRYVSSSNRSAQEMLMQTGASTYSWVVIKENTW